MQFQIPGYRWGGAAAASIVADYVDVHARPISSRLTNSELVAVALMAMDAFNIGVSKNPNYASAQRAAADWGTGSIASGIYRRQLIAIASAPVTTTTTTTKSVNNNVSTTNIPASSSSAAAEIGLPF